ncbi:MAG: translocation/assembly module TamB domain-containing protein [Candidatus Tyrphobacter sp.]
MRKRAAVALALLVVLVGLAAYKRHAVVHYVLVHAVALATGYDVRLTEERIGSSHAAFVGIEMRWRGRTVLRARRIDVWYSLRDLLPGSAHRFGLIGIALDDPSVALVAYADGTYDVPLHAKRALLPSLPAPPNAVPLRFFVRVTHGSIRFESTARGESLVVRNVEAAGRFDTAGRTHYAASGDVMAGEPKPFSLRGTVDPARGFAMQRFRASVLPLPALANMLLGSSDVAVLAGTAYDVDAKAFAIGQPYEPMHYGYSFGFTLLRGALTLPGLVKPIEGIDGRLSLFDDTLFIPHMRATLAGIPLRAQGAIYDFARPQIRVGVTGDGDLSQLRYAFAFSARQALVGPLKIGVLVEGSLHDPLIVATVRSPRIYYRGFPFDALHANVIYHHALIALAPLQFRYGGVAAYGEGSLELGTGVRERLDLHFEAPANRLPYAGALLGEEPLVGDAALSGTDLRVDVSGSLAAASGIDAAAALFDFGPNGVARVAPFWMSAGGGDLLAGFRLDRPSGTSAFWLSARDVRMGLARSGGALPNLALPQMPPIEGDVRSVGVVGGSRDGTLVLAGNVDAGRTAIARVPFDALQATFDGSLAGASISSVSARGPWGEFTGNGAFSGTSIVARGRFAGDLGALQPLAGGIAARGSARGDIAIGLLRDGVLVQVAGLKMEHASVAGVPVRRADGTLVISGDEVHVYDAHVMAAGGDLVASGSIGLRGARARGGTLSLVGSGLDAVALRALGVPLQGGRLALAGRMGRGASLPTFSGAASFADVGIAGHSLSGSTGVRFDGSNVRFAHAVAGIDGIYGFAQGEVANVASHAPSLAIHAVVPAGGIASALATLHEPSYAMDGTFDANLSIGGTIAGPSVSGEIGTPAGSVNGLPFLDGSAHIFAAPATLSASDGSVLVGTTRAAFDASLGANASEVDLRAPSATFSDFNNFFDTGDTLAGHGAVAFSLRRRGVRVRTDGNVDVRGFRYRSLPIGDTHAAWSSRRNVVRGSVVVGGPQGLLHASGSIALRPHARWQQTIERSRYDMRASVQNLDLGLWVAVLGFPAVPITGRAFGEASMTGAYPALHLDGSTQIRNGTFGRFPMNLFAMRFRSQGRRLEIQDGEIAGPGLDAQISGSLGLHARDPLDLHVRAQTNDLPSFLAQVTRVRVPLRGAFAGTLAVGGNFAAPIFDATFTGTNVHAAGVPIESLFGSVRLQGDKVELYDAGATFTRGTARITGDVPLRLRPPGVLRGAPISFTLDATNVDASILDSLFGYDTALGGTISTHVSLSGTVQDPRMSGNVRIQHGSYSSKLDEAPISNANAAIAFSGSHVSLASLTAHAGSGSIAAHGDANLAAPDGPAFSGSIVLDRAQFSSPQFGSATIDGPLRISRTTGDALLSGSLAMTNTTIPFAAFVGGAAGGAGVAGGWPIAFDLALKAGQNVRVRGSGYGAGLDISGTGDATLAGTLAAPTLLGRFDSTGGSLTYFDRSFRVLQGRVDFAPTDGIVPTLHAVATTTVVNPDPDVARNPFGSATITILVNGPVDDLKIDFVSDPTGYTRDQIIAMLAPFGGFISGIQFNPYEVEIPGGAAVAVNNAPVPGGVFVTRNGTLTVSQEAFSILNAQFASGLLAPIENVLGQTLGLGDVNLTLGYFGNVGVSVRRVLGKTVTAVYSSTFGQPSRQTFGLRFSPDQLDAAALQFFYQTGQLRLFQTPGDTFGPVLLGQPLEGQSGFSFTFQHFFH